MHRQRGVALIVAVMVVAFASTISAGLLVRQNLAVHRTSNMQQQNLAWWYVVGLEEWATTILKRDRNDNNFDHLNEFWAQPVDFIPVDEGALAGRIIDQQGRYNLRWLEDQASRQDKQDQLARLISSIDELNNYSAQGIAAAIADWIDPDTQPGFPQGAEDGIYLSKPLPYRAANQVPESLSELLLIEGIDHKAWVALTPHLSLLPGTTKVNVNTATAEVLLSMNTQLSPSDIDAIIQKREQTPYDKVSDYVNETVFAGKGLNPDDYTVQSDYFVADGAANIGNVRVNFSSLLHRDNSGKTRVIAHSRNSL